MSKLVYFSLLFTLFASLALAQEADTASTKDPFEIIEINSDPPSAEMLQDIRQREHEEFLNGEILAVEEGENRSYLCVHHDTSWYGTYLDYDVKSIRCKYCLSNSGVPCIAIFGGQSIYGNGGGTSGSGVTIMRVDSTLTSIFDYWYESEEENFGRTSEGYIHRCGQQVDVDNVRLLVGPMTSRKESGYSKQEYKAECNEIVKAGSYRLIAGKLQRTASLPKVTKKMKRTH